MRLVDARCASGDWAGLLRLRDRCAAATRETGRQLWPAATLAEYRLALLAPAEWATTVLDGEAGRFTIGPLSEVVAVHHTWAELAPHLARVPVATFVAHERSIRGESIDPSAVDGLPLVLDIPVAIQAWEPDYPVSTYTDAGAEHPEPPMTPPVAAVTIAAGGTRVDDVTTELAVRHLVEPWTSASTGRAEVVCVEGTHLDALGALGVREARVAEIERRKRWRGWRGRARPAVPTDAAAGWRTAGSRCGGCSARSAICRTSGRRPTTTSRPCSPTCVGTAGTPTSRQEAGACNSRSKTSQKDSPGQSTPSTRRNHHVVHAASSASRARSSWATSAAVRESVETCSKVA